MPLSEVASAVGAEAPRGSDSVIIRGVSTDSREVKPGDLFVAIKGTQNDGHRFLDEAIRSGAVALLVSHTAENGEIAEERLEGGTGYHEQAQLVHASTGEQVCPCHPMLHVADTVEALGGLAAYYRTNVMNPGTRVIAVTGSNGKTTTKQLIHHILSSKLTGRASPKSFNNSIGVPLTLLAIEQDDEYVVVEIGTNAPGEVASLGRMALPDIAVITSIGEAHLEGLSTIEAIVAEKTSLFDCVRPGGINIVNVDRAELRRVLNRLPTHASLRTFGRDESAGVRVVIECADLAGIRFVLDGRHEVSLPIPGAHHACNAAAAWLVGGSFGITPSEMVERQGTFTPGAGRAKIVECGGVTIVDDSYNANPASMLAAIETLGLCNGGGNEHRNDAAQSRKLKYAAQRRRVLVAGDMLELGARSGELHEQVLRSAIAGGVDLVVTVGERYGSAARSIDVDCDRTQVLTCAAAAEVGRALVPLLAEGDCVWIKGSRSIGLERAVEDLKTALAAGTEREKLFTTGT